MPLHKKANFEYAGSVDHAKDAGPELRPVLAPVPPLPGRLKSKRPTLQPSPTTALGSARGFRRLGGL